LILARTLSQGRGIKTSVQRIEDVFAVSDDAGNDLQNAEVNRHGGEGPGGIFIQEYKSSRMGENNQ
jgi:hypothetical protein